MYSVYPDEKGWVYCTGIKHGNEEDWDLAWDRLQVRMCFSFNSYTFLSIFIT